MQVSLAAKGDAINDPSEAWSARSKTINFGRLSITGLGQSCQAVNFDPLRLSPGFAPSQDPVLLFRSPAYAISHARRLMEQATQP